MIDSELVHWITADSLIAAFGDQAYHKGCAMAVEALNSGDPDAAISVVQACKELMFRGYHKSEKHCRSVRS